jgi:hypothetical protein
MAEVNDSHISVRFTGGLGGVEHDRIFTVIPPTDSTISEGGLKSAFRNSDGQSASVE